MSDGSRPSEPAALDHGALEAIRALQSDSAPDLLVRVIRLYLESTPELIERIRAALAANDHEAVRTAAHTLKSSSANLGATALAELCRRLELAARAASVGARPPYAQAPELQVPELQARGLQTPELQSIEREYRAVRRALELEIGRATA
jgi:HPt (histidine-containing phosphotransfer) domain-containing protein